MWGMLKQKCYFLIVVSKRAYLHKQYASDRKMVDLVFILVRKVVTGCNPASVTLRTKLNAACLHVS